jgi:hypothetical protein
VTNLVFGQTPPADSVIVTRPVRSTPCALPHFTRAGDPKTVPGLLYRKGTETQVLCQMHGKQVYGL